MQESLKVAKAANEVKNWNSEEGLAVFTILQLSYSPFLNILIRTLGHSEKCV